MAPRRPEFLLLACAAALLAGCGHFGLRNPAPDFRPGKVKSPWRIHCETARTYLDEAEAGQGSAAWPHGRRWVWARDEQERPYVIDGEVDDGFVKVLDVRLWERGVDVGRADVPPTAAGVRLACERTLERLKPRVVRELGKVRGAREGEELNAPLLFPADAAGRWRVKRMVVFGDSLSDTGKLRQRLHVFPRAPYWMGRFSNGPIWTDYFEWEAGVPIQHHAYGGAAAARYASVGDEPLLARIRAGGQLFLTGSIDVQADDYLARNLVGRPVSAASETAFLIWAGANDYVWKEPISGAIGTFLNQPRSAAGYERVVEATVAALAQQVTRLHGAGARLFVLVNLPDLGRTPIVLQNRTYFPEPPADTEDARKFELARRLSALTRYHNRRLAETVVSLGRELDGAEILLVDSAEALERIHEERSPSAPSTRFDYGFDLAGAEETIVHGDRRLRIAARCYHGGYTGTSSTSRVCRRPSRALFWDVLHPTSLTHCWQAFAIQQATAKAGWTAPPPSPQEQRTRCLGVVDREARDELSIGLGAAIPPGDAKKGGILRRRESH